MLLDPDVQALAGNIRRNHSASFGSEQLPNVDAAAAQACHHPTGRGRESIGLNPPVPLRRMGVYFHTSISRKPSNRVVSVINHIHQYPSTVFVFASVRRAKETRRRSLIAVPNHGKHMFSGASLVKGVTQPMG